MAESSVPPSVVRRQGSVPPVVESALGQIATIAHGADRDASMTFDALAAEGLECFPESAELLIRRRWTTVDQLGLLAGVALQKLVQATVRGDAVAWLLPSQESAH